MDDQQYPGTPAGSPAREIEQGVSGVLRGVGRAVEAEAAPGHREGLIQAMGALAAGQDALDLAAARLAARMRDTGTLAGSDFSTVTGLLRDHGRTLAQDKAVVQVADRLDEYAASVKAAEAGEIGFSHLAKVVGACEKAVERRPVGAFPDPDDVRARAEPILLEAARTGADPSGLGRLGRTLLQRICPEEDERENRRSFAERKARYLRNRFGFTMEVQGDIASDHIVSSTLDLHTAPPGEGDDRTADERRFDALVQLCENRLAAEGAPVPAPDAGSAAAEHPAQGDPVRLRGGVPQRGLDRGDRAGCQAGRPSLRTGRRIASQAAGTSRASAPWTAGRAPGVRSRRTRGRRRCSPA